MPHNKTHPDSEPLIAPPQITKFNKRGKFSGLLIRRRDPKGYQEKYGRVRLGAILCGFAFLLIYLTNLKPYQQHMMVVRIPDDDMSLPGPKGMHLILTLFNNKECYACILYRSWFKSINKTIKLNIYIILACTFDAPYN